MTKGTGFACPLNGVTKDELSLYVRLLWALTPLHGNEEHSLEVLGKWLIRCQEAMWS